jgi:hypothetical protein
MATFTITDSSPPYHTLRIEFADQQFDQQVISTKEGDDLNTFLQSYADQYEADWLALPPPEEPTPWDPAPEEPAAEEPAVE